MTELDLSDNSNISELRCEHNQLTRLMVPQGSLLEHLYCHSNQLDEDALNTLFDSLGQVLEPAIYYPTPPRQYRISFNDNPGADGRLFLKSYIHHEEKHSASLFFV